MMYFNIPSLALELLLQLLKSFCWCFADFVYKDIVCLQGKQLVHEITALYYPHKKRKTKSEHRARCYHEKDNWLKCVRVITHGKLCLNHRFC